MKKLNKKGYLTIEIILGSVIAFAIAFFLIEITAKMISNNDDTFRDTIITTDNALIISGVKEVVENAGTGIIEIKCENNSCNITFSDGVNGKLYIKENKVIYEEDNVEQYIKQLDSSLTNITLDSSIKGKPDNKNNIYFKITGKNIFLDKEYNTIIPINTTIGPIGKTPSISCTNGHEEYGWTNEKGKGSVNINISDVDGDFETLYYSKNYYDDISDYIEVKSNSIEGTIIKINNAETHAIKVYGKDKAGNVTNIKKCYTNLDTLKPVTPYTLISKNSDETFDLSVYGDDNNIESISTDCCTNVVGTTINCAASSLSHETFESQSCTVTVKPINNNKTIEFFTPFDSYDENNIDGDYNITGSSGIYKYTVKIYDENGTFLCQEACHHSDIYNSDYAKCENSCYDYHGTNHSINEFYFEDWAGNISEKLTVNVIFDYK